MKNLIILLSLFLLSGCKTSSNYDVYEITTHKYSTVYQFKNSKSVVFNDSITKDWFIGNSLKTPFSLSSKDVIQVNKKLDKKYLSYTKEWFSKLNYDSLPDAEHYRSENKKIIKHAKYIQSQMKYLNKQLAGYKDTMGRKLIVIKIINPDEDQNDIEKNCVGLISLAYNVEEVIFALD